MTAPILLTLPQICKQLGADGPSLNTLRRRINEGLLFPDAVEPIRFRTSRLDEIRALKPAQKTIVHKKREERSLPAHGLTFAEWLRAHDRGGGLVIPGTRGR